MTTYSHFSYIFFVSASCNPRDLNLTSGSYPAPNSATTSYPLPLVSPLTNAASLLLKPHPLPLSLLLTPLSRTGLVLTTSVQVNMTIRYGYNVRMFRLFTLLYVIYKYYQLCIIVYPMHIPQPYNDHREPTTWCTCLIRINDSKSYSV